MEQPSADSLIIPDYAAIARQLLRGSLRLLPGEALTIIGRTDSLDFCEALELEARRIGAFPFLVLNSDASLLAALRDPEISDQQLATSSPQLLAALRESQAIITTFFDRADPAAFHDQTISPDRLSALLQSEVAPSDIIYDGSRRWLGTEVPTRQQADALGCSWPELHNTFWQAMAADYNAIGEQAARLRAHLENTREIRLLSDSGTDLTFLLGGRKVDCDDGQISEQDVREGSIYLNMPSGEVCLAPLEVSANGRVFIEKTFWQGQIVRDLQLEIDKGIAWAVAASEGLDLFRGILERNGGDCARIGEFGIGLNPAVNKVIGFTLLDEKIIGTAHIALGENRPLGGINNSSLHWDMVIQNCTVLADGMPILAKGKLLV